MHAPNHKKITNSGNPSVAYESQKSHPVNPVHPVKKTQSKILHSKLTFGPNHSKKNHYNYFRT
jgi:hypothetical protein